MRKTVIFFEFVLVVIFFSGCNHTHSENYASNYDLSEFVLGKWRAERTISFNEEDYHEELFVKFINAKKLKFCSKSTIDQFCTNFSYEKIDDNTILVGNRRAKPRYWKLMRQNEKLLIYIWNNENHVEFVRDTSKFNILLEVFNIYW